jgi:hypothetical protein
VRPLIVATAGLVLAGWYALSCWLWPMRDCWVCRGTGHHRPTDSNGRRGRVSRPCRWCKASGKRLRIGRRMWNRARRHARQAS